MKMGICNPKLLTHAKLSCRSANQSDLDWLREHQDGWLYLEPVDNQVPGRYRIARGQYHGNGSYMIAGPESAHQPFGDPGHLAYLDEQVLLCLARIWEVYSEAQA